MKTRHTHLIRQEAARLGFAFVGIARAERLDEEATRLEQWLQADMNGKMQYMENHFEKRVDPTKLVEGAKSVITLMYNYYTDREQSDPAAPKLSKYAYGKDYHYVIKHKLKDLLHFIREEIGEVDGRCFVDSAPVLERDWAKRSGVGWVGRNTLLIHPKAGSYYFLAELILDLDLVYDHPIKDYCGTCTRCIEACPTDAIAPAGYLVDGSKCISYFTIELREALPEEYRGRFENWMFGCDICQEVCPWNRFAKPHEEEAFEPHPDLLEMSKEEWYELTEEVFREVFRGSAVKRTKYAGLKRNIAFLRE
ncbi:tRNA epoxyqueuosine(34) reductase QueG [Flavilitoribacter nigricans]|uniref:Epoxyqueuosine reductase n=1 Tax=Flavilitoribacter nigricans (strain ATCC 23147 / DSM 23189 / NBRC 102662 / NCIMB 1420 / SS-2) TaxID=1122177 RepID=A0A2D0NE66_FLAN2|nr:tRNA epoxyqueuosine(34) reductase QueG [Flavilitoribacter nigricans]PHN06698.1 tRNA epoxyqueuosine(34) reductase QueG [Flavilitoribacter nigricans DSM 23189 = NBRC 102662]